MYLNNISALSEYITLNYAKDQCDYIKHSRIFTVKNSKDGSSAVRDLHGIYNGKKMRKFVFSGQN